MNLADELKLDRVAAQVSRILETLHRIEDRLENDADASLRAAEALAESRLRECEQYAASIKDVFGHDHLEARIKAEARCEKLEATYDALQNKRADEAAELERAEAELSGALDAGIFQAAARAGAEARVAELEAERDDALALLSKENPTFAEGDLAALEVERDRLREALDALRRHAYWFGDSAEYRINFDRCLPGDADIIEKALAAEARCEAPKCHICGMERGIHGELCSATGYPRDEA